MSCKRLLISLGLPVLCLVALLPAQVNALEPAYGTGIVVDGYSSDWNLSTDFVSDMYNAGRNDPSWNGYAVLSTLYLRYDCQTHVLYALVLDVENDGEMPSQNADDAWLRIYNIGLPGDKLIDGSGNGGTLPRSFAWVHSMPSDPNSPVIGYEACAQLDEGSYEDFEAHLDVAGATSSTGKYAQGRAVPLTIHCDPTVGASEGPARIELSPAQPNPFNPSTFLAIHVTETGPASLKVYDLAGRQVATLLDGMLSAGTSQVQFQAGSLSSGLYMAVLSAGGEVATQKLLLLK